MRTVDESELRAGLEELIEHDDVGTSTVLALLDSLAYAERQPVAPDLRFSPAAEAHLDALEARGDRIDALEAQLDAVRSEVEHQEAAGINRTDEGLGLTMTQASTYRRIAALLTATSPGAGETV